MEKEKSFYLIERLIKTTNYKNHPLPEGFAQEMSAKLEKAGRKDSGLFSQKLVFSTISALVIFTAGFFAGNFFTSDDTLVEENFEQSVIASIDVQKGETFTVKLVYDSDHDVEDVNFDITLPEGLAFHSKHPDIAETKTIKWTGILKKGRNEIPFVVTSIQAGVWRIDAYAQFEQKTLSHEIVVNSMDEDSGRENV